MYLKECDLDTLLAELEPLLLELEEKRIAALWPSLGLTALFCFGALGFILLVAVTPAFFLAGESPVMVDSIGLWQASIGVLVSSSALFVFLWRFFSKDYVHVFKQNVIQKMIASLVDGALFWPSGHIESVEFEQSLLFRDDFNRYEGDDLVEVMLDKTKVRFSELHVKKVTGSGKNKETIEIFDGLFFIADFNKNFDFQLSTSDFHGGERVELDNPAFNDLFDIYTTDTVQAFYVLSPSFIERLTLLAQKADFTFSLIQGQLYIAISMNKKLLEPTIFRSLLEFRVYEEYLDDLLLVFGIVEDLSLNTRIWGEKAS